MSHAPDILEATPSWVTFFTQSRHLLCSSLCIPHDPWVILIFFLRIGLYFSLKYCIDNFRKNLDPSHPFYMLKDQLWGKYDELKDKIFRYVNIEEQHYAKLQATLTAAAPERFQEGYVARRDVRHIKSHILDLIDSSKDHTDSSTTCDPRTIGSQMPSFPFRVKIMDLRPLKLNLLPEHAILVREEYELLEKYFVEKLPRGKRGTVFLTGQPGIGEFLSTAGTPVDS
jgi:hypothetical protein